MARVWSRLSVPITIAVLFVSLFSFTVSQVAAEPSLPLSLWWVSIDDAATLDVLASTYDVWEVDHSTHRALLALSDEQATLLQSTHTIVQAHDQTPLHLPRQSPPVELAQAQTGIPGFSCYRTVTETISTLDALVRTYPQLAKTETIGASWDKITAGGPPGDDLIVLRLTNQASTIKKFNLVVMGALHARELATAEVALRFAESLAARYGNDPATTWLLDHGEVHIVPIANPDGRRFAEEGLLWRKNTNNEFSCPVSPPFTTYGVDLNRNSSFMWNSCVGCSSANACAVTYRGTEPASEPEVQAIQAYLSSIFADARPIDLNQAAPVETPGIFISLHSYGELILYPWGWSDLPTPNDVELSTLAGRFADSLGYRACQGGALGCLYRTDGTTDDWAYGTLGVASYTFEIGTTFFQSCDSFEATIAPQVIDTLHEALAYAPRPYQFPAGPTITALSKTSLTTDAKLTVTLTATQTFDAPLPPEVASARLAIDASPWLDGTPTWSLGAVDGETDHLTKTLATTIDLSCIPDGPHTLIAQVQDDKASWGAPAFETLTLSQSRGFTVTPTSAQTYISGTTANLIVTITNTSSVSDSYLFDIGERVAGNVNVTIPQTSTAVVGPGASITAEIGITRTSQNKTATQAVAVVEIRSKKNPLQCHESIVQTAVPTPQRYFMPWLPINQLALPQQN